MLYPLGIKKNNQYLSYIYPIQRTTNYFNIYKDIFLHIHPIQEKKLS